MIPYITHQRFLVLHLLLPGALVHKRLRTLLESEGIVTSRQVFTAYLVAMVESKLIAKIKDDRNISWEITDEGRRSYQEVMDFYRKLLT